MLKKKLCSYRSLLQVLDLGITNQSNLLFIKDLFQKLKVDELVKILIRILKQVETINMSKTHHFTARSAQFEVLAKDYYLNLKIRDVISFQANLTLHFYHFVEKYLKTKVHSVDSEM